MKKIRQEVERKYALVLALLLVGTLMGCTRRVEYYPCTSPTGEPAICTRVVITFFKSGESFNASTLLQTREVDPLVYANDSNAVPTGTVTLTLNSGGTVSHSQNLYYDSGAQVSPVTAGKSVLVYRPVNPAALQNFINTYQAQTSSVTLEVNVKLRDVSGGSVGSSAVDSQGNFNNTLDYIGTVNTRPPARDREPLEY